MNGAVDRLIAVERAREILACLTGSELLTLQLIMAGWTRDEIAAHMGVSRDRVARRLNRARRRIARTLPELAPAIDGRTMPQPKRNGNGNGNGHGKTKGE